MSSSIKNRARAKLKDNLGAFEQGSLAQVRLSLALFVHNPQMARTEPIFQEKRKSKVTKIPIFHCVKYKNTCLVKELIHFKRYCLINLKARFSLKKPNVKTAYSSEYGNRKTERTKWKAPSLVKDAS